MPEQRAVTARRSGDCVGILVGIFLITTIIPITFIIFIVLCSNYVWVTWQIYFSFAILAKNGVTINSYKGYFRIVPER